MFTCYMRKITSLVDFCAASPPQVISNCVQFIVNMDCYASRRKLKWGLIDTPNPEPAPPYDIRKSKLILVNIAQISLS